jgi:hypothetical protein
MAAIQFYVYELFDDNGAVQYVGKGSKRRLLTQQKRFNLHGRVVQHFDCETKAYKAEMAHIAKMQPALNKCKGGNGNRAKPVKTVWERKCAWQREIERIGTRAMAARILLSKGVVEPSKLEMVRRIAYG